jgi:hypothetical protein
MVPSAGPGRSCPVLGHSSCILHDREPSDTGLSHPDTTEAISVAIGTADTGWADTETAKVSGPDPDQPDAGLEDTDSSDAGSTCVELADDSSAASDTDDALIDIGTVDPEQAAGKAQLTAQALIDLELHCSLQLLLLFHWFLLCFGLSLQVHTRPSLSWHDSCHNHMPHF